MRREVHSNYRLVVTPDLYLRGKHAVAQVLLDEMAAQVRRHVDNVGQVRAEWDTRSECSHCLREWETVTAEYLVKYPGEYNEDQVGEPLCCEEAAAEWRAERDQQGGAA